MKKLVMTSAIALASVALQSQAAVFATWDVSAALSGTIDVTDPVSVSVDVSGGGTGGTATLDTNGTFTLTGLDSVILDLSAGFLGGAELDLAASGDVVGTYDAGTQTLSGNVGTLNITENGPCVGSGLGGGLICDTVPGFIDFSLPFVLTAVDGLADPITFDLVNDFSFLLGNLGGVAALELSLSNIELSEVPVPAAAWLFGSALVGLAGARRRA